jgi:hypothetical protein
LRSQLRKLESEKRLLELDGEVEVRQQLSEMRRIHAKEVEAALEESTWRLKDTLQRHVNEFEQCNTSFHKFREEYIAELEDQRMANRELKTKNDRLEAATIAVSAMSFGMAIEAKFEASIYKERGEEIAQRRRSLRQRQSG